MVSFGNIRKIMRILAIDPGNIESAYVIWDGTNVLEKDKIENSLLLDKITNFDLRENTESPILAIEMVASYGMPVGATVFDTCVWIGRFIQEYKKSIGDNYFQVYRKDIKMHLCHSPRAKDSNVIQALVDRFGDTHNHGKYGKGVKKNKGFFFGFHKDIWQAMAVAVYFYDELYKA